MALVMEAAITAVEIVDMGLSRLGMRSRSKQQARQEKAAVEERALVLEGELARQRLESRRLQAALEEYKMELVRLQERNAAGVEWLGKEANSEAGTADLLRRVEERVSSPEFLEQLRAPQPQCPPGHALDPSVAQRTEQGSVEVSVDVESEEWWQWVTDKEMKGRHSPTEECAGLDGEEAYEVLDSVEVVDSITRVLARFLATNPEFTNMTPEELQAAIRVGCRELRSKGVMRALWDWGKFVYKASRWATAAYNWAKYPVMARAILMAVFSSTRIILGIVRGAA